MRAYSSGVRIIEGESAAESRRAAREGRPAPREGRNDRHLVSVLERGLQSLERLDGLAVHIEVHVVVNLARLVAHEALERAEPPFQLVEQALHVERFDGDAVLVVGGPTKRRRDVDLDAHVRLLPFSIDTRATRSNSARQYRTAR